MSDNRQVKMRQRPVPRAAQPDAAIENAPTDAPGSAKARQREAESSDAVGKNNPPKHTRFKPGQSGNPRGRPKGSRNTKTILGEALDVKVVVREGGKTKRMSKREVGITKAVNKFAETGSLQMMLAFDRTLGELAESKSPEVAASSESNLSFTDAMLQEFLRGVLTRGGHVFDEPSVDTDKQGTCSDDKKNGRG